MYNIDKRRAVEHQNKDKGVIAESKAIDRERFEGQENKGEGKCVQE